MKQSTYFTVGKDASSGTSNGRQNCLLYVLRKFKTLMIADADDKMNLK